MFYYDPEFDRVLMTCSIPLSYRGNELKITHLATMLCALTTTLRVAPTWDNNKISWMELDDIFSRGYKVIAVFVKGDRPEQDQVEQLDDPFGIRDLGKEPENGSEKDPPPSPE